MHVIYAILVISDTRTRAEAKFLTADGKLSETPSIWIIDHASGISFAERVEAAILHIRHHGGPCEDLQLRSIKRRVTEARNRLHIAGARLETAYDSIFELTDYDGPIPDSITLDDVERLEGLADRMEQAAEDLPAADPAVIARRMKEGQPDPPAPATTGLNVGWKWAEEGHVITKYDKWNGRFSVVHEYIGTVFSSENAPIATPDWHNPEGIADPGEGWRFLVKGEIVLKEDQMSLIEPGRRVWQFTTMPGCVPGCVTYRTPATRPLPPVLADEKEGQP